MSSIAIDPWSRAVTAWHDDARAVQFLEHAGDVKARTFSPAEEELLYGGAPFTKAGITMGAAEALRVSTVFACRRVIAEDIAKMPRSVRRQLPDGDFEVDVDHPVHRLITIAPNEWMTAMELFEWWVGTAVVQEAAYIYPTRDPQTGRVLELLPLLPGSVGIEQDPDWTVRYRITTSGGSWIAEPGALLKLQGPPRDDALTGFSVSRQAREAVALAAAMEASQSRFHANDLRPPGVLTTEKKLTPDLRVAMREDWQRAYGPGGTGGVAVLDNEFKFQAINSSGLDSQVVDNRKFQIEEMCRFFRVIPTIIGHNSGSQAYGSVEQMFTAHNSHTLHPWVTRVEQALTRWLMANETGMSIDLDMDALARGTGTDRINFYDKAIKTIMTPNEAREREGLPRIKNDPDMDRVQIMRNNTGTTAPGARQPAAAQPAAAQPPVDPAAGPGPAGKGSRAW